IYGFLVAGALITMGTLGDRIGRRRLLLIGAVAFGGASVVAAFSTTTPMLIATRALLGLAGATIAPSTLSLLRNMFHDPRQRTMAVGVWITSYSVGGAIGPLVGGVLLQHFWWGSVFLIAVPVMVLLLVLAPILLPEFREALVTYLLATFVIFGCYVFIAQYLQLVLGLSPLEAGLWTLPWSAGFIVGSMLTPLLVRRFTPSALIAAGLAISAAGFLVLTQVDGTSGLPVIVTASVIFSLSLAPVFTLTNDTIIATAPPERAGAAAGISETSSELGGALGIAMLGSLGAALYRGAMTHAVPRTLSPGAIEAARGTLGGALAVASALPTDVRVELLNAARAAFSQGLRVTAAVSAALTLVMAVVATVRMRRRSGSAPP